MKSRRMLSISFGVLRRILLALSVACLILIGGLIGRFLIHNPSPRLDEAILIAVLSSLLTGLFTAISGIWVKRSEESRERKEGRFKLHYQALVELEHERAEFGGILSDNVFILERFIKVSGKGGLIPFNPKPLPRSLPLLKNLLDVDCMNDIYDLYNEARKFNDDTEGIQKSIDELRVALINGPKGVGDLRFYLDRVNELMAEAGIVILRTGRKMETKNIRVTAILRERLRLDKLAFGNLTHELINEISPLNLRAVENEEKTIIQEMVVRTRERTKELEGLMQEIKT